MSLNNTPNGERIHIGIFGRRNAGKSSIFNAITGQSIAVVSDKAGTTTDPVSKAMEILPLGPVLITDTPGFDDVGELGELRIKKTYDSLRKTEIVVLVLSAENSISEDEINFIKEIKRRELPYIICINKDDLVSAKSVMDNLISELDINKENIIAVSATKNNGIKDLVDKISYINYRKNDKHVISDLIDAGDTIVLVVPIDSSAPKGRLILPQQQVIRDALEVGATIVVTRETELSDTLAKLKEKPKVVVTDSQAFKKVANIVPGDVFLTSFSILMARYKGELDWQVSGVKAVDNLKDGANILICEGCTHHRQCEDIGSVKIPKWLKEYTGKEFIYKFTSGGEFPENLSEYDLIIHCGGCTLNEPEMKYRIAKAKEEDVPITNYGVLISYMNGILERSLHLLTIRGK